MRLVMLLLVAGLLAACSGTSSPAASDSPTIATLATSGGKGGGASAGGPDRSTTTTLPKGNNPTALVDEWAACERRHGDPNQADPIIDSHGVINIVPPRLGQGRPAGDPHGGAGTCGEYLAKAQVELRAEFPVNDPGGPNQATYLKYVECMRSSGVPNYPYPSGPNDSVTNFNGTGVDPNSPHVVRVNDICGRKLGLPAWWINGWGPPGDISIGLPSGGPRPGALTPAAYGGGS
jgi:hypothetical protein